jgi:hypothetical protein
VAVAQATEVMTPVPAGGSVPSIGVTPAPFAVALIGSNVTSLSALLPPPPAAVHCVADGQETEPRYVSGSTDRGPEVPARPVLGSNVTSAPRRSGGARLRAAGAVGARIMGGGFGGHILGLIPHTAHAPEDAIVVTPSAGARILAPAVTAAGSGRWPPHA